MTAGLREQAFNVTQLWPGILKFTSALFETTGNLEACTLMAMDLLWFSWTWADTDLEQMLKKKRQIFVKMDTECWKLLVKKVFRLKELIVIIQKL